MERKGSEVVKETDAVVYSTMDHRKLARAALYIEGTGVHLNSISEMIRIIEDTFDSWLDKKGIPTIESTHEAKKILQHMFKASLNPGGRKGKTLLENLQKDEELMFHEPDKVNGLDIAEARTILQRAGYIAKPEPTPEQRAEIDRQIKIGQESYVPEAPLTPLQAARHKAIAEVTRSKIEESQQLAAQFKTDKPKEPHNERIKRILELSQKAITDDEALRILVDII